MILRLLFFLTTFLSLFIREGNAETTTAAAAVAAPDISTVVEGYNLIAKLPCVGCPFLYRDGWTGGSEGKSKGGWKQREDGNALLLNISLPYTSLDPRINNAALTSSSSISSSFSSSSPTKNLPRIYATQVLSEFSSADLSTRISTGELDSPDSAYFGISYTYSFERIKGSTTAQVLYFDITELWTDLLGDQTPLTVKLNNAKQQILEVVVLRRPLYSAGDEGDAYEIVRARLVLRSTAYEMKMQHRVTMEFLKWNEYGEVGSPSHMVSSASDSLTAYITSGVWGLLFFILAVIALFVVVCLFCIFACGGGGGDEYGSAQRGKRRGHRTGSWHGNDVEKGKGRFRSAEELGLRGGGRIVGVGKSD